MRIHFDKTWEKIFIFVTLLFAIFGLGALGYFVAHATSGSTTIGWGGAIGAGGAGSLAGGISKAVNNWRKNKSGGNRQRGDEESKGRSTPEERHTLLEHSRLREEGLRQENQQLISNVQELNRALHGYQKVLGRVIKLNFAELVRLHTNFESLQMHFNAAITNIRESTNSATTHAQLLTLLQHRFPSNETEINNGFHLASGAIKDEKTPGNTKTERLTYLYQSIIEKIVDHELAIKHYRTIYQDKYQLSPNAGMDNFSEGTLQHLDKLLHYTRQIVEGYEKLLLQFFGCILTNVHSRHRNSNLVSAYITNLERLRTRRHLCSITLYLQDSITHTPNIDLYKKRGGHPPVYSPGALEYLRRSGLLKESRRARPSTPDSPYMVKRPQSPLV